MVIAYHVIFTTYGTWLPNDPRGSYSKGVYSEQLKRFGEIKYGRQYPQPGKQSLKKFWKASKNQTMNPPFFINDNTRLLIADAFSQVIERLNVKVVACAIMNDHVHIVILRTRYKIQYIVNQLKGAATRKIDMKRTLWTRSFWKVFIDSRDDLKMTIEYVNANPVNSGFNPQSWDFVQPIDL